ncbi:PQQ-binding-like beta-propeller repeat protein [Streptomyces sp. NPDC048664]|uniref:outer membrane protein assembly factor BamB family protein n=1 Tax=Streptomyces sp. NPDC048664 TaxID=3154505 RepID=UPI003432C684
MSQPPPPPNQPPSGGFGPPPPVPDPRSAPAPGPTPAPTPATPPAPAQTPPPAQGPGYGYPQPPTPPQQPHGQPHPPSGPPAAAGYGYPHQAPAGYGYPQQQPGYGYPHQQPGYGYPQQPGFGAPQPPTVPMGPGPGQGGGRTGLKAQVWIVVSAVVAIALIVGGGVWYAKSSSSGGGTRHSAADRHGGATGGKETVPADPRARTILQVPAPRVADKDEFDDIHGSWLTGSVYAKTGLGKIVGYAAGTGAVTWTLPLHGQTCAASPEVSPAGIAAVVTETRKRTSAKDRPDCADVTAFDVATGRELWTKPVTVSGSAITFEQISVSAGTVAAAGYEGGAGFELATGKLLWRPQVGACEDDGYAGGEQLVVEQSCGDYDTATYKIQLLDPRTGHVKWTYPLPRGLRDVKVMSTKPVVFGVRSGDTKSYGISDIFSLDDSGRLRTKISLPDGRYDADCDEINVCHGFTVGNDKLYLPTKEHDGSGGSAQTNEIVAFSLATGKTTGDKVDAGDGFDIFPLRMDGPNLLAYKGGSYEKSPQVLSVDGTTGKPSTLLELPDSEAMREAIGNLDGDDSEMRFAQGRLCLAQNSVDQYDSSDGRKVALCFGPK